MLDIVPPPEWTRTSTVEYFQGDVCDAGTVARAMQGADAVIHSAFASPRQTLQLMQHVNVDGVGQTCRQALAHGIRRVVLISSTVVERKPKLHPFWSGAAVNRMDAYRATRTEAEALARSYSAQGLQVAMVRPKTFVGAGRISAFTIVFDWIRTGQPVVMLGSGQNRYQLLEIGDMAEGIRLLAGASAEGVFYLGAHQFGTLADDLRALIEHAGSASQIRLVPSLLGKAGLTAMELAGMVPTSELHYKGAWNEDSVVDTSRAVRELGWQPRFSNVEALTQAYDWYLDSLRRTGSAATIHQLPTSHKLMRHLIDWVWR